jgi:hypothetical protein
VDHNLGWGVTVGEDIEKILGGHKIESWVSGSLRLHELVKGFLANGQLLLNFFKSI